MLVEQLPFPFPERDGLELAYRRLWLMASERAHPSMIRDRCLFVEADKGTPVLGASDLLLQRTNAGHFALFLPEGRMVDKTALTRLITGLPDRLAVACSHPGAKGEIRDLLAISFDPARRDRRSGSCGTPRNIARSDLEEVLLNLSLSGETGADAIVEALLGEPDAPLHPLIRSVLRREPATSSPASLAEPELPGFETTERKRCPVPRLAVERLCGFPIRLDASFDADPGAYQAPQTYRRFGPVPLDDSVLMTALCGLRSPHRRILASASQRGAEITVSASVVDELHALLHINRPDAAQDGVNAFIVRSETIDFPVGWVLFPERPAVFSGRAKTGRRHQIDIRAALSQDDNLHIRFAIGRTLRDIRSYV